MDLRELLRACEDRDYTAIRQAGWLEPFMALRNYWAKRFELTDFVPYLQALRDERPDAVMAAIDRLRGEKWRPMPSGLYREVNEAAAREQEEAKSRRTTFARKRKDQQPETLARVRWLLAERGEHVCVCLPRPNEVKIDQHYVLRCRVCDGIEQGQVYEAEDDAA